MWDSIWTAGIPGWLEIMLAAGLDMIFPKPKQLAQWHGALNAWTELVFRLSHGRGRTAIMHSRQSTQRLSWIMLLAVPVAIFVIMGATVMVMKRTVPAFWTSIIRILLLYMAFDGGRSIWNGGRIALALRKDKLDLARGLLSRLLQRDTEKLSARGIARATSEAVVRGMLHGAIAPLFCMGAISRRWPFGSLANYAILIAYFYLGLLAVHRFAETHPSEAPSLSIAQLVFSWLMFFPSRVFAGLILTAAWVFRKNAHSGFWFLVQDNRKGGRSGEAWPMAALAGSLGIRLGGGAYYGGVWKDAPSVGFDVHEPGLNQLAYALGICLLSGLFCLAISVFLPSLTMLIAVGMALAVIWGMMRGLNAQRP